jgi:hypothetical protein
MWLPHFRPDIGARYDGTSDPVEFLQQYAASIRAAGGNGRVMANWFMMATKGEPADGSAGCPQGPFRPGGTSASASSTNTHPVT